MVENMRNLESQLSRATLEPLEREQVEADLETMKTAINRFDHIIAKMGN